MNVSRLGPTLTLGKYTGRHRGKGKYREREREKLRRIGFISYCISNSCALDIQSVINNILVNLIYLIYNIYLIYD